MEKGDDRLAQLRDVAFAERADREALGVARTQHRRVADAIDLVEHEEARHGLRPDLLEHGFGHRELPLEPGIARVDDVEEQRRLQRLVEGRLERRDESVRKVLDEPDRVADEHARDGLRVQGAHRRVERREELVGDQHLAPRERAHQGGLARVRVADERDAREPTALLPPSTLRPALGVHRDELLTQLGDPVADLASIDDLRRLAQARRHVGQARDLDLGARFARARVAMEDLEDHHRAVHHLAADLLLEVAGLRGRDLVVDEDDVRAARERIGGRSRRLLGRGDLAFRRRRRLVGFGGALAAHEQAQLLPLAGADVRRRVEVRALLRERGDDDESERLRELPQLGQGRLELDVVDVRELHGHHGGALRLFLEFLHDVRAA